MANAYPYDEFTRQRVAQALYGLVPLFYRVQDQPPQGNQELQKFLRVLAAPLATLRQSIDEAHANFFIDTCGDAALPLLAQLVGTTLVFPDMDTNRRDLRGTISRRERKGTRPMLEELGQELTEQLTVVLEGWQRLILSQNLNTQRPERTLADVRPVTFGSSATGPLDLAQHFIDIRTISNTTGRYHPQDITHWVHVTRTFPFEDATPHYLPATPGDPDPLEPTDALLEWRYAFHPLGLPWALRQRPASDDDHIGTDRILANHFAARPADFFGVEGRFVVRIAGLPAAVAASTIEAREASTLPADPAIVGGIVTIELLNRPLRGWESGRFELAVGVVDPFEFAPDKTTFVAHATIALGLETSVSTSTEAVAANQVVMLRLKLRPNADGTIPSGGYFPGATVAITGGGSDAARAHSNPTLASLGFLRGALAVTLPATWVLGEGVAERWLYLAADGSVFEAQTSGKGNPDIGLLTYLDPPEFDPKTVMVVGPGAAWPPLPRQGSPSRLTLVTPPPRRGPNILHGGIVLNKNSPTDPVGVNTPCMLVFAFRYFSAGFTHELIGRLSWTGPNPKGASWELLDADEENVTVIADVAGITARLAELVNFRNKGPNQLALSVRFECAVDAIFTPSEVAWSSDNGDTVLLYLIELVTSTAAVEEDPPSRWPNALDFVSEVVEAHEDGSTVAVKTTRRRFAEGQVAPLRGSTLHLRRRVKWASLEDPPAPPNSDALRMAERCLSVDVELGRFALYGEVPQPWPLGPLVSEPPPSGFVRPPNVTVAFEDASTGNVGAHPVAREPTIFQLQPLPAAPAVPTRIVSRSGVLHVSRDPELYVVPFYTSVKDALAAMLADALAAIAEDPEYDPVDEVVQIQDDAIYPDETLIWPDHVRSLTITAADSRRPVLLLTAPNSPTSVSYTTLMLRGIAFGGVPVTLPTCAEVNIQFCTVIDANTVLTIPFVADGVCNVLRSVTAGLALIGDGVLNVTDSIIDAGIEFLAIGPAPMTDMQAELVCERSTIIGAINVFVLTASECIFDGRVEVTDRFHGCVRFSAVPTDSVLPQRHQVAEGLDLKFLSLDRNHPSYVRLSDESPRAIRAGAEDGSELGAFNHLKSTQRLEAFEGRLRESTPVGLVWALLRVN